jgi:hypothetical protein
VVTTVIGPGRVLHPASLDNHNDRSCRAGEESRDAVRRRAAHAGSIGDDTLVYGFEFHALA